MGTRGIGSLTMMQRTLATLSHCIAARLVRRRPSSARSTKSFYTLVMGSSISATNVPPRFCPCRRQPRYVVTVDLLSRLPPTSSASLKTKVHAPLIGYRRCGPERHTVAGRSVLEFRGRPWTPCLLVSGWDVSTTDMGVHGASVSHSATTSTSAAARAAHSASGSTSTARVVNSEQRN